MKGDFSRFSFDPNKRYTGVRMQQGRVQLDADWNEQVDLQLNRERRELRDIIGYAGGPRDNLGFKITANGNKLKVGKGHYYVAGRLCWNDHEFDIENIEDIREGTYLAYLDVWERHVTWLEDTDIREVALGGPDTATRTQLVSQVKLMPVDNGADCSAFSKENWVPDDQHMSTGKMRAQSNPVPNSPDDICAPTPQSGYTGLENQLYRVEIHEIEGENVIFKWSRENGCIATRWTAIDSIYLTVMSTVLDEKLGFKPGDWIELTDEAHEKACIPGILAQLVSVGDNTLEIDGTVGLAENGTVRRWEGQGEFQFNGTTSPWIPLEDGIEIAFEKGTFQPGDYWTIPARAFLSKGPKEGQGDILWPKDNQGNPSPENRHGPDHVYSPLAICNYSSRESKWQSVPCQKEFPPLTNLPTGAGSCCTVYIRPGEDIQEAIDNLDRQNKNVICLLPGRHLLDKTITIKRMQVLSIVGCGPLTEIDGTEMGGFAFKIDSVGIFYLESLNIRTSGKEGALRICGGSGSVMGEGKIRVHDCNIYHQYENEPNASVLSVYSYGNCKISNCSLFFGDTEEKWNQNAGWISLMGQDITFSNNQLQGLGIVVCEGSEKIKLSDNDILMNRDSGILLGGKFINPPPKIMSWSGLRDVKIINNFLCYNFKSGICLSHDSLGEVSEAIPLEFIQISKNRVTKCCCSDELVPVMAGFVQAGILICDAESILIDGNNIDQNGLKPEDASRVPACGIFLYNCKGVIISGNIINDNGCDQTSLNKFKEETKKNPYQGGIVAQMLFDTDLSENGTVKHSLYDSNLNLPAASIRNNHVTSPAGQALFIAGLGTMSIQSNFFKTLEISNQHGWDKIQNAFLGCGILIKNGLETIIESSFPNMGTTGYTRPPGKVFSYDNFTQFHDNQFSLQTDEVASLDFLSVITIISSQLSVKNNQIRAHINGDQLNIGVFANLIALGVWVNVVGNLVIRDFQDSEKLKEMLGIAIYSYSNVNTTVNNQANGCILAEGNNVVNTPNQYPDQKLCDEFYRHLSKQGSLPIVMAELAKEKINLSMLEELASLTSKRHDALVELKKKLEAVPETNQNRIKELDKAISAAKKNRDSTNAEVTRWNRLPKSGADDWLAYGLVTYVDGHIAEGLIVKVFDKDHIYDDLLGKAKTDELGNFYLVFYKQDFEDLLEGKTDLYVAVIDENGKQLFTTKSAVRFEAGRKEYFHITLPS